MKIRFPQDIVPLSDLKIDPGKYVNRTKDSNRPILLTSRGRGVAVMQGLVEIKDGKEQTLAEQLFSSIKSRIFGEVTSNSLWAMTASAAS